GNEVRGVSTHDWQSGSIVMGDFMTYPVYRLFISVVCLLVAGLLYWVLGRTRLGMMIRAGASNREMISSLGIDINRLYRVVFAIGVALQALPAPWATPSSYAIPAL